VNAKLLVFKTGSAVSPIRISRVYLPFHLPGLGQELASVGYPSLEDDPIRREPIPINPRYLITGLRQFRFCLVFFLFVLPTLLGLLIPRIGDIIAGVRIVVFVLMDGRLCGWMELPDPGDASDHLYGGVNLVLCMACGFVDEGRPEGRVSNELERARAHCGMAGRANEDKGHMYIIMYRK